MAAKKASKLGGMMKKAGKVAAPAGVAVGGAALVKKAVESAYPVGSRGVVARITGKRLVSPALIAEMVAGSAAKWATEAKFKREAREQDKPTKGGMRRVKTKA